MSGSLTATPGTINLGQSVTLSWSTTLPYGCSGPRFYYSLQGEVGFEAVGAAGVRTLQPIANESYILRAKYLSLNGTFERQIGSVSIGVVLPQTVYITANHLARQLVQALGSTDRTDRVVMVADQVQLDLSNRGSISIAKGVTLRGWRGRNNPGARLYTTTRHPDGLFRVDGDNVRITGVRIEGPDMGVVDGDVVSRGIFANSTVNLEIDHNEISGWTSAAIEVQDTYGAIPFTSPYTVRIHDNYIHHNQHVGGNGYGVATRYGAYALIEHNVFDWNRHAIAADARDGTGYEAVGNLVLENGGLHMWIPFPGVWTHTHQFDAHGSESCWGIDHNCGMAGHSFYIHHNTFLYTADEAIKLRGTPALQPFGMFVAYNVFAHDTIEDAVSQTESGLKIEPGNVPGNEVDRDFGTCDFDGDGANDYFMTTGATWWYASAGQLQWWYLNTSTKRLPAMALGYFDGDNRCDVSVDGTMYSGGKPGTGRPTRFSTFAAGAVDASVLAR
jgi:hypothetical protein